MTRACEFINDRHGIVYNLTNIPIDDPETFEFISKGIPQASSNWKARG